MAEAEAANSSLFVAESFTRRVPRPRGALEVDARSCKWAQAEEIPAALRVVNMLFARFCAEFCSAGEDTLGNTMSPMSRRLQFRDWRPRWEVLLV